MKANKKSLLWFLFVLIITKGDILSQTADYYFHSAANLYYQARYDLAVKTIQEGLEKYPNDPRLNSLNEKIDEKQKQQNQQDQQSQNENGQQQQEQQQTSAEEQNENKEQQEQAQPQEQRQELSKEEAERLLEAMKEDQDKMKKEKAQARGSAGVDKDW